MKNKASCSVDIGRNDFGEWLKVCLIDDEDNPWLYTISTDHFSNTNSDDLAMCGFAMLVHYKKTGKWGRLKIDYIDELNASKKE